MHLILPFHEIKNRDQIIKSEFAIDIMILATIWIQEFRNPNLINPFRFGKLQDPISPHSELFISRVTVHL